MQLYYTKSSPYANSVCVLISEIGIKQQVKFIESAPFDNQSDFLAVSPLGKVPCLVDNGETILDSEVICDYLDANFTGGTLFNPIYADWRLKTLFSICSGLMDSCVARRVEVTRAKDNSQSDFWLLRHTQAIKRGLSHVEEKLALMPVEFSVLQINLLSCLGYLDFRHKDINWRQDFPRLNDFFHQYSTRTSLIDNPFAD